ncbi:hypothetical protein [Piscibacillus salipiscarius]|uniref:hypothetical protein n=1 Tax=Piscibacillus salipiscarius TaxID=299480 RepID=UPI0006D17194|nr:hypothetical protein [Piscibacillus salipiscarius]
MGMPEIPDFDLNNQDSINLMLASIGLEELSLAHLVNAEAEKIQRALGTLQIPGTTGDLPTHYFPPLVGESIDELFQLNRNASKILKIAAFKEFLLLMKLEDLLDFEEGENGNGNGPVTQCECSVNGVSNQPITSTTTIDGTTFEDINTEYTIRFCENCDPTSNNLNFNFDIAQLGGQINLTQGRVTQVVNCDEAANEAILVGTIRRANIVL